VSEIVLDASALLAILSREPGSERWTEAVAGAKISAVNLSEVIVKLTDLGMAEDDIRRVIEPIDLDVIPFDDAGAWDAGLLRPSTRAAGLSLGDRACLALGQCTKLPVLTADQAWKSLRIGVQIRLVR
ncbi:MAG: type II toxin-antitoxin system VapC family toxin, partial [Armatimonadota bacterium]